MVRSPKPSSLAESARAVPASSRTRAANRVLRRILMGRRVIALARRSSALLHRNMGNGGTVVHRAGGGIPSLLVKRLCLHLCPERQPRCSASTRLVFEKCEKRLSDPAPADVIDNNHPLNPRHPRRREDEAPRAARNPIDQRQRMDSVGLVMAVQLEARPHALLFHEHRPAQPQALLDVLRAPRESNLDHACFGASHRSVATAQRTAPSTQKSARETRLLVENPGMLPPTLMELRKFRVGSESCRNARMVPMTLAPAISPEASSTPGPLSASAPLSFRLAVRSAMYRTMPPIMMGVLVDSGR